MLPTFSELPIRVTADDYLSMRYHCRVAIEHSRSICIASSPLLPVGLKGAVPLLLNVLMA